MTAKHLPPGFTFTQTALRTYRECPYHFRLRYLEEVPPPAFLLEPAAEAAMERGRRFHELVHQHVLGMEVAELAASAGPEVASWWQALAAAPPDLADYPQRYSEARLSVPLGAYRLAARYDLLAVGAEAARIVDWKTGRPLPPAAVLAGDMQARVYLFVLAEGGATYHAGRPLAPQSLSFLYWHASGPHQALLSYSGAQRDEDGALLRALVAEIAARPLEEMRPVDDTAVCGACAYAPLCGRPVGAAACWEMEEDEVGESESWLVSSDLSPR